jgi:ferric-dicitrate binding protein FerR (iron transport regulator)
MDGQASGSGECRLAREVLLRRRTAELSVEEAAFLGEHLLGCEDCREFEAGLAGVFRGLEALGRLKLKPPAAVRAAVLKGVRRRRPGWRSSAVIKAASSRRASSRRGSTRAASRVGGRRRERSGWARVFAAAAVAATILVACLVLPRMNRGGPGVGSESAPSYVGFVRGEGSAVLHRAGRRSVAVAGDRILAGDRFESDADVQVALFFRDGSAAVIGGGAAVTVLSPEGDKRLVFDRGKMFASVARRAGQSFVVNPGRSDQVAVLGTAFEIERSDRGTVLRVAQGEVSFGSGGRMLRVAAGLASRAAPGGAPAEPEPVAVTEIASWRANTAPEGFPIEARTDENAKLPLVLGGQDAERDHLSFEIVSGPGHGVLSGEPPELTYVPERGFSGKDVFSFRVFDGRDYSEPADVSISVRGLPGPPEVSLMVMPTGGPAPLTVRFDASASGVAAPPAAFRWDFGEGTTATGASGRHVYTRPGSYTVTLTVTDRLGRSAVGRVTVKVLVGRPLGSAPGQNATGELTSGPGSPTAGQPAEPGSPGKPDEPGKPAKPGKPEEPGRPDKPDKPDKPEEPGKPEKPEDPGKPEKPDKPDKPVKPTKPPGKPPKPPKPPKSAKPPKG